ncbi:response regulator transcription factor [Nocardia sp. NBC_01730]|uniref:response regulator n=1 Tax=Nocardia sp. NBC_01730 TaxID=2975998 RepID=UPI002E1623CD|nr:response regulator transcription factor [Nocardia sp. NBC_01730]
MTRVTPLRCLIIDDSPNFFAAARGLLEQQGVTVVGVAATGAEALRRVAQLRPDVALVDVNLGAESGFAVAERLTVPVILISTHSEQDFAELIAESPAVGFLSKSALSSAAIDDLLRGDNAGRLSVTRGT